MIMKELSVNKERDTKIITMKNSGYAREVRTKLQNLWEQTRFFRRLIDNYTAIYYGKIVRQSEKLFSLNDISWKFITISICE